MQCNCGAEVSGVSESYHVCDNQHDVEDYNEKHPDIRSDYAKRTGATVSFVK